MNCARFDRWLDGGRAADAEAEARTHARGCARCAAAREASLELEVALGAAPPAPAGFADRVMARVADTPQGAAAAALAPAPVRALLDLPALPWWVRAAIEPGALLAAAASALLLGWGGPLFHRASLASGWISQALAHAPAMPAPTEMDPRVMWVVTLAFAPAVAWASLRFYAWGRRLAG